VFVAFTETRRVEHQPTVDFVIDFFLGAKSNGKLRKSTLTDETNHLQYIHPKVDARISYYLVLLKLI